MRRPGPGLPLRSALARGGQAAAARRAAGWLVAVLLVLGLSPVAVAQAAVSDDLNALRAQHGLNPLRASTEPAALAAAAVTPAEAAAHDTLLADLAATRYREAGGTKLPYAYAAATIAEAGPWLWFSALDPRADEVATGADGTTVVLVNPQLQFSVPLLIAAGGGTVVVPGDEAIYLLMPPGSPELYDSVDLARRTKGGRWVYEGAHPVEVGYMADDRSTMLATVTLAGSDELQRGVTYRVRFEKRELARFLVQPASSAPRYTRAGTLAYDRSLSPALRKAFQRSVKRARSEARTYLGEIDGAILVYGVNGGTSFAGGAGRVFRRGRPYEVRMSRSVLRTRDAASVTLHELGHIVDLAGLDEAAMREFMALFRRSAKWRSCYRWPETRCVRDEEIFAEEFARWALPAGAPFAGGYGVPRLSSRKAFGALLRKHFRLTREVTLRAPDLGRFGD